MYQKIKRNSLIERALKRETNDIRVLPREIILSEIESPNPLQKRVLELSENFDFVNFLLGMSDIETAIGVITPKQVLFLECRLVDVDAHAYNFQALYDAIYDYKINIIPVRREDEPWQTRVMKDSNIVIQLTKFGDFYLWCPENVNDFQLSSLQQINELLKRVQRINSHLFKQLFLDLNAYVLVKDGEELCLDLCENNMDLLLKVLKSKFNFSAHKKK